MVESVVLDVGLNKQLDQEGGSTIGKGEGETEKKKKSKVSDLRLSGWSMVFHCKN